MIRESLGRRIYLWINAVVLLLVAALCLVPILHVIALSFSKSSSVMAGHVTLFPVNATLLSYKLLMQRPDFFASFRVSLLRVLLGVTVNMALIMLTAYPLSKKKDQFHGRTAYAWYMILTIIFSGGTDSDLHGRQADGAHQLRLVDGAAGRDSRVEHGADDELLPQSAP